MARPSEVAMRHIACYVEFLSRREAVCLSKRRCRSSEKVSPKRDIVKDLVHRIWDLLGLSRELGVRDGWITCRTEFIVGKAGMRSRSERGVRMTGEGVREAGLRAG
ncbi:hypothetical protein DEO72_LG8g1262 [Vigna unguiculata]|uniref:Uncharacterized protein n=1 Tax=Vigna unguiculata TaxID=3917 RepID=A0A4D6MQC9_VIGUN|nr:hypothetical protein DEO72_LG8g1262 [Vigna unguiculata]